jgi:hypothetical protein
MPDANGKYIILDSNKDDSISRAIRILSKDEDPYFLQRLEFYQNNFNGEILEKFIEETVENCLNLSMQHALDEYARYRANIGNEFAKPIVRKLRRPTWRGSRDNMFTHECITCHSLMKNELDGCRCSTTNSQNQVYTTHDGIHEKGLCDERFGKQKEI